MSHGYGQILPADEHNARLLDNVHPADWKNPRPATSYNLVVVGAGTGGLVTAAGAAGLGAKVALVERHLMGGDCLNVGCVPSKALIRSAQAVAEIQRAARFGVHVPPEIEINFAEAMARMRQVRARLSPIDSVQRFNDLGVDVFLGEGRFSGPDALEVDGQTLHFKKAVIATGARAAIPPVQGLAEAGFLTNETVFSLTERPACLAVIGGGPLGCELAQAFQRLGSEVIVLHNAAHILNREDVEAAEIVQQAFLREGIRLILQARVVQVELQDGRKLIHYEGPQGHGDVLVDEILVAAGRAPNVEGLNLEAAGVEYDTRRGIQVNDYLQTTNPRIYAVGDICMDYKFTHLADATARIAIQNALFLGRAKVSALTLPWCTYTDPEIAHVGLSETRAREQGMPIDTFVVHLEHVDRAVTDGADEGFVKVHVKKGSDRIVGATIVAHQAGEMISELTLAMAGRIGLKTIARVIHPYPTRSEAIKKVADAYNRSRLTPLARKLLTWWLRWAG